MTLSGFSAFSWAESSATLPVSYKPVRLYVCSGIILLCCICQKKYTSSRFFKHVNIITSWFLKKFCFYGCFSLSHSILCIFAFILYSRWFTCDLSVLWIFFQRTNFGVYLLVLLFFDFWLIYSAFLNFSFLLSFIRLFFCSWI